MNDNNIAFCELISHNNNLTSKKIDRFCNFNPSMMNGLAHYYYYGESSFTYRDIKGDFKLIFG